MRSPIRRHSRHSTRIRIELEPVKRFVSLRICVITDLKQLEETMARIVTDRT